MGLNLSFLTMLIFSFCPLLLCLKVSVVEYDRSLCSCSLRVTLLM